MDIDKEAAGDRSLVVTWSDPRTGAAAAVRMAGLDYMRAMLAGEVPLPPIASLMGITLLEVEPGRVVVAADPAEYHYNPIGLVHGGLMSTLLDSAMGCAVHTTLPQGTGYNTVELHLNFVRSLSAEMGRVWCEGKVIHGGKRLATAEGRIVDREGKLYAHGTTTCLLLSGEQAKG
jgi:uncharacterized protein (TIGR00369 family)